MGWGGGRGVHYDVNPVPFRCKPPGIWKLTSVAPFVYFYLAHTKKYTMAF